MAGPDAFGRRLGQDHNHSGTGEGGDDINPGSVSADDGNIKIQSDQVHYCREFDGADADTRLDNAISESENGDTIMLEKASYTSSRTGSSSIDKRLRIRGAPGAGQGSKIDADWTLTGTHSMMISCRIDADDTVSIDGNDATIRAVNAAGSISIGAKRVTVSHISGGGSVTFESGTNDGEIGIISGLISVTDNGSNSQLTS